MKRSQMRARIALSMLDTYKDFKLNGEHFPFNIGQISNMADNILAALEDAGMLPPSYWKKDSHEVSNEWDPENEE